MLSLNSKKNVNIKGKIYNTRNMHIILNHSSVTILRHCASRLETSVHRNIIYIDQYQCFNILISVQTFAFERTGIKT